MFIPILILSSVGLALTALFSDHSDEELESIEDSGQDNESSAEENDLVSISSIPLENIAVVSELSTVVGLPDEVEVQVSQDFIDSASVEYFEGGEDISMDLGVEDVEDVEDVDVFRIDISSSHESESTPALDDFNSNPNTPILQIDDITHIHVDLDSSEGSIGVLRADYYERLGDLSDSDSENLHVGANFYFIPAGQSFPDEYTWSESGAVLYNDETYVSNADDFGGIRLLLRVDTGLLTNITSIQSGIEFSNDMFLSLTDMIIGDGSVQIIERDGRGLADLPPEIPLGSM